GGGGECKDHGTRSRPPARQAGRCVRRRSRAPTPPHSENLIPAPPTCGRIPPSPHRSETMTRGWRGGRGVPWESSRGGTGRTGGELRATIRNFALPAPTRRTGEAEPQLFADYPLRGESLAGAASHGEVAEEHGHKPGGMAAPEFSARPVE